MLRRKSTVAPVRGRDQKRVISCGRVSIDSKKISADAHVLEEKLNELYGARDVLATPVARKLANSLE